MRKKRESKIFGRDQRKSLCILGIRGLVKDLIIRRTSSRQLGNVQRIHL